MSFSHSPVISLNLERGGWDANFGWFKKKLDDDLSEKGRKIYIGTNNRAITKRTTTKAMSDLYRRN